MRRSPILVTGGAGFIGSHIVDRLLAEGERVVVVDDLSTGSAANLAAETRLEQLDISAPETVALIGRLRPSAIVHAAAQASVTASLRDPVADARVNILGTLNVLQGGLATETSRFVYVTTGGALYGDPASLPVAEDAPIEPLSPYGLSKWAAERYLNILAGGRMSWLALRLGNVFGPRQGTSGEAGVVAIFADSMRRQGEITIDGDGEQTRDFVFVADVAEAALLALRAELSGSLNVATGTGTSINELFEELAGIAGYTRPPFRGPPRPADVRHSVLDVRRAASRLGWEPRTPLRDGLIQTYQAVLHR